MTAKERVLRSLRHESVDRTPFFYLGVSAANTAIAECLGVAGCGLEALLRKLDVDVRFVAGPTHSFTEDTPITNILAVYEVLAEPRHTWKSRRRGTDGHRNKEIDS